MKARSKYFISLIFIFRMFPALTATLQQKATIILHDEQVPITPKEFYIANVTDERSDRSAIAWLISSAKPGNLPEKNPVDLQGGGLAALKGFILRNLSRNTALRPITIGLKKFMVVESASENGLILGQVTVVMSFNMERGDDDPLHLVDYNGDISYTRTAGPPQDIEPTLRRILENGLAYLNTWMNREAGSNIQLAKSIKITFTDYKEQPEGDSIYYAVDRPLTWDDFKSETPNSRYDAEVFPTLGYDENTGVANSVINITIVLKPVLPKSAAWVKNGSRNNYTLNHEQRHFDIAKIAAEHFKQKLKSENLTTSNYEGLINVDYLDAYRDMGTMQKQYDDETRHGADQSEQERWNEKIDKELRELGIKK